MIAGEGYFPQVRCYSPRIPAMNRFYLRLLTGLIGVGWLSGCSSTSYPRTLGCGSSSRGLCGTPCSRGPIIDDDSFGTIGSCGSMGCPAQLTSMPASSCGTGSVGILPSYQGGMSSIQGGILPSLQPQMQPAYQPQATIQPQIQPGYQPPIGSQVPMQSGTLPPLQSVPQTQLVPNGNAVPIQANPSSRSH